MHPNVSKHIQTYLNKSERTSSTYQYVPKIIQTYPNATEFIQMYFNISKHFLAVKNDDMIIVFITVKQEVLAHFHRPQFMDELLTLVAFLVGFSELCSKLVSR